MCDQVGNSFTRKLTNLVTQSHAWPISGLLNTAFLWSNFTHRSLPLLNLQAVLLGFPRKLPGKPEHPCTWLTGPEHGFGCHCRERIEAYVKTWHWPQKLTRGIRSLIRSEMVAKLHMWIAYVVTGATRLESRGSKVDRAKGISGHA